MPQQSLLKRGIKFTPLLIKGLECLEKDTECLGDCPDAAYFGPNVHAERDAIEMLRLPTDRELPGVTVLNHRQLRAAAYAATRTPTAMPAADVPSNDRAL